MEESGEDPILIKSKQFLSSRKNSNVLIDLISFLEDVEKVELSHILAIETIFVELQNKNELSIVGLKEGDVEFKYRKWLIDCFKQSTSKLLEVLSKSQNESVQQQVVTTLLLFVEFERKGCSDRKTAYNTRLAGVIEAMVKRTDKITSLIQILKEYVCTKLENNTDDLWRSLALVVQNESQPNENTVSRVISIIDSFPKEKSKNQSSIKTDSNKNINKSLRLAINKVWDWCLRHHQPAALKKLLIVLLEHFMPHLNRPIFVTDFLINALNAGGATSLLALQGIYFLILKHNIDYPNIYGKLYSMLEPEIFTMKYKARFFYLLDLFLTSTHLPQKLVASFVKRLSRLALRCPPHDILFLLPFIGNLLIRHPGLKRLINHPAGDEYVDNDPFNLEENDPMKTNAINSSLWEVKSLQQHVLPSVSKAAMFINEPLPSVEWDLSDKLETTSDQIFDRERRKKMKIMSTTFERPSSLSVPRTFEFGKIWLLE